MATDRLKLYNGALLICGQRQISSLTENVEARQLLDNVWNDSGVDYCLSQAQWRFAMRAQRLDYSTSVEPAYGLRRAFEKTTDWILTSAICQDERYQVPLLQYTDETGILYADLDQIFVKFVSSDTGYGGNLSLWGPAFTEYVKHYFAGKIVFKLTGDETRREYLLGPAGRPDKGAVWSTLVTAKNRDAIAEPTRFAAQGTWTNARRGRGSNRGQFDGGNPNQLIG